MKSEPLSFLLAALTVLLLITGCKTHNSAPVLPLEEIPPSQYGQPGSEIPMPPRGRFGYNGNNASENSQTPPAPRDVRDMEANSNTDSSEPPRDTVSTPSSTMFANPVPGNPLVVTLPGRHASLGQISIEKYDSAGSPTGEPLKRGTPVQIPDPNNPGQKIYFKVP